MIYVPGLLTGRLSGKAGNTVASAGPFATTINVASHSGRAATAKSSAVRASLSTLVGLYKALSPTDLAGWKVLGLSIIVGGRLSRSYALTAPAAFLSVNRNLSTIGIAPLSAAPSLVRPPSAIITVLTAVGPSPGPTSITLELITDPLASTDSVVIYGQVLRAGSVLSPPRRSWKVVAILPPSSSGPYDITSDYLATCGPIAQGQTIWVRSSAINDSGFTGGGSTQSAVVS